MSERWFHPSEMVDILWRMHQLEQAELLPPGAVRRREETVARLCKDCGHRLEHHEVRQEQGPRRIRAVWCVPPGRHPCNCYYPLLQLNQRRA